jgi:hypothetical protein
MNKTDYFAIFLPSDVYRDSSGQVMWDLWWTKWHWGRFSPGTSVSPVNSHYTNCAKFIIYHPVLVQ